MENNSGGTLENNGSVENNSSVTLENEQLVLYVKYALRCTAMQSLILDYTVLH